MMIKQLPILLFSFFIIINSTAQNSIIVNEDVELEIVENYKTGIFKFKITNNSDYSIPTSNIATMYNRIAIVFPNGKEEDYYYSKNKEKIIDPNTSFIWKHNIIEFLSLYKDAYKEGNKFSIYWKLYDRYKYVDPNIHSKLNFGERRFYKSKMIIIDLDVLTYEEK